MELKNFGHPYEKYIPSSQYEKQTSGELKT